MNNLGQMSLSNKGFNLKLFTGKTQCNGFQLAEDHTKINSHSIKDEK